MPSYQTKTQSLALVILGIVSAVLLVVATTGFSIYFYGSTNRIVKADAAIVLGAAVWGNEPSPVFRERINHAINLYKKGIVRNIIFTGGVGQNDDIAEAVVGKQYAMQRGVKHTDILVETKSHTTHQNLQNAQQVASKYNFAKFLIVSDPLHLKRSVLMARDLGMDAYPSPTPTTRYRSFKSQFEFLTRETYFYFVYLLLKY